MQQIMMVKTYDGQVFSNKTTAGLYLDKQLTKILHEIAGQMHDKKVCEVAQILKDSLPELQKANDILTDLQTYETE